MRRALVPALLLVAVNASAADYDTCFHVVPPDSVATLQADLDCSGTDGVVSFVLETGARLELNGHTMVGNLTSAGVVCRRHCSITGPGTISGYLRAIYGERGTVDVSDLTLAANHESIDVNGRLNATRVDASSTRYGVRSSKPMTLNQVTVTNSGGDGILGKKILGDDVTVTNCQTGVMTNGLVQLSGLHAHDNLYGVSSRRVKLTDSTVAMNGTDLFSVSKPVLTNTSCDTSVRLLRIQGGYQSGPPWGVCAND